MPLQKLAHSMHSKGFIVVHDNDSVIEKIIYKFSDAFHGIIKHRNGHFYLDIKINDRTETGLITRDEYEKLKEVKSEIIGHLNNANLGLKFNHLGDTR